MRGINPSYTAAPFSIDRSVRQQGEVQVAIAPTFIDPAQPGRSDNLNPRCVFATSIRYINAQNIGMD